MKKLNLSHPNRQMLENWKSLLKFLLPNEMRSVFWWPLKTLSSCFKKWIVSSPSQQSAGAVGEAVCTLSSLTHPTRLEEQSYKASSLWHRCSFNFSGCSHAVKPSLAPGEFCWLQEIYHGVNQRPSDRGSPYVLLECWLWGKGAGSEENDCTQIVFNVLMTSLRQEIKTESEVIYIFAEI